jgi:hypothetical protein
MSTIIFGGRMALQAGKYSPVFSPAFLAGQCDVRAGKAKTPANGEGLW